MKEEMNDLQKAIREWPEGVDLGRDSLFVERLRVLGLDDQQISSVTHCINETCNECWDAESNCQCWNDE